jgi:hypothetical protein
VIELAFDGWAEVRLATDPDPSDEPRGVSGWTFAIADEPDLDRIIRLQPAGAVARSLSPPIGVVVRSVSVGGARVAPHPLGGAAVNLLDDPVFEGRNGIVGEDGQEPILPFHIAVSSSDGAVALQRKHLAPATDAVLAARPGGSAPEAPAVIAGLLHNATGPDVREQRRLALQQLVPAASGDLVAQAALAKRLRDITDDVGDGIAASALFFALPYEVVLKGASAQVRDPSNALGGTIALDEPWTVKMWFGAFDADVLCMFVKGTLQLPFAPVA